MFQIGQGLHGLAILGLTVGGVALGFGLILKGVLQQKADPIIRFGLYVVAGSLLIYLITG